MATSNPVAAAALSRLRAWMEKARHFGDRLPVSIILNIAALLLLSAGMAKWSWQAFTPPAPALPRTGLATASEDRIDIQGLLAAKLFGEVAQAALPTAEAPVSQIPATALNLVLTGVVAAGPDSLALIRVNQDPETPFAVGEEITRGVMLRAVHADRAIIHRRGQLEALLLEDNSAGVAEVAGPTAAAGPSEKAGIQSANIGNNFAVDRDYAVTQMSNPEFLRQALIVPHAGGGFLVRQITPGSVYEQLGLKVGDVIRKANGRTLNNMEDALRLYQQIGGVEKVGEVELEIQRGGRSEQLRYTVQ